MTEYIAGVELPDSRLVTEATELARGAEPPLLFQHCCAVYLFGTTPGTGTAGYAGPV